MKGFGRSIFRNGALFEKEEGSIAEIESLFVTYEKDIKPKFIKLVIADQRETFLKGTASVL